MAERRMFAKTIIDSDSFLDMPLSAQALYFHLSMRADDEGFINNPKKIMRMIGASEDDLKILIAKNFIIPFDSGIVVIKHWRIHNYIRADRLVNTAYQDERQSLYLKKNGAYTLTENDDDGQMSDKCQSSVSQVTDKCQSNVSIGKDSIGKISIVQDSVDEDKNKIKKQSNSSAHLYGVYSNVVMTQEEYAEWLKECPKAEYYINRLSEYIAKKGATYPSHLATLRKWWAEDKPNEPVRSYDLDDYTQKAVTKPLVYKKR